MNSRKGTPADAPGGEPEGKDADTRGAGGFAGPSEPAPAQAPRAGTEGPDTDSGTPVAARGLVRKKFQVRRRDQDELNKRIGELLVEFGYLRPEQLGEILRVQATLETRAPRKRFGLIARELGLIQGWQVDLALARQFDLPSPAPNDRMYAPELLSAYETNHPTVEVLRGVRERLSQAWLDVGSTGNPAGDKPRSGGNAVAIVSVERGDGRSFIAANLAITFAQYGRRTLLIDANLRRPRQHQLFHVDDRLGLSTILAGRSGTESVAHIEAMRDLYVMPAGPIPPNPQDLLARPEFSWLLFNAGERFEVVLIDTPAWSEGPDAETVCRRVGAAALVVRANQTSARAAQDFVATLRAAQTQVIGLVFNR